MRGTGREGRRGVPEGTTVTAATSGVTTGTTPRLGAPRASMTAKMVTAAPGPTRVARAVQVVTAIATSATGAVAARPQGAGVSGPETRVAARPPQGAATPTRL